MPEEDQPSDELLEDYDEVDDEVAAQSAVAMGFEGGVTWEYIRQRWLAQDDGMANVIYDLFESTIHESPRMPELREDIGDYAALAQGIREHPENKVKLFDFAGDPIGFGLKGGRGQRGTVIRVVEDAIDVCARAEEADGRPISDAVFLYVRAAMK